MIQIAAKFRMNWCYRWALLVAATGFVLLPLAPPHTHASQRALWKINADGSTGLARFAGEPGHRCGSPDWSPDGKFVAFDTWPDKKGGTPAVQIAIVRADGSDLRKIGHGAMPSWSPDSKQIAVHTYENPQTTVVMNADGSGRETIVDHWGSPRWCPRGNRIATILNGNIALYDLATAREQTILPGQNNVFYGFAVSPDGKRICFGDMRGDVFLATLDEQRMKASVRPLVTGGMSHHISFGPDGKRIVFSWQPKNAPYSQLHIMKIEGDAELTPIAGQDKKQHNCDPDWSPDGKTIVFVSESADP